MLGSADHEAPRRGAAFFGLIAAWGGLVSVLVAGVVWIFFLHPDARQEQAAAPPPTPETPSEPVVVVEKARPASDQVAAVREPAAEPEVQPAIEPSPESRAQPEPQTQAEPEPPTRAEPTPAETEAPAFWRRHAAAFDASDTRPRIAVVVAGLGLDEAATKLAIQKLPPNVTLSFTPYAGDIARWIAMARFEGHEVMLDLPLEPANFPESDPGPLALMTGAEEGENLRRLDRILARGTSYVGVAARLGSRFTASDSDMRTLLQALKQKGLIYFENHSSDESVGATLAAGLGTYWVENDRFLDDSQVTAEALAARLAQVERIALTRGFAAAMAGPYPVTIRRLADWAAALEARGFALAPVSALVTRAGPV